MKSGVHPLLRTTLLLLLVLLPVAWSIMVVTHEIGHVIGGYCSGGSLVDLDLRPWHLPYSFFQPDPHPLITLWSGPLFGVACPVLVAVLVRRDWMWFIACFCVLANGLYLATAWIAGDRYLDTPKLLEHGAHPATITLFCVATIGWGYVGFRRSFLKLWSYKRTIAAAVNTTEPP